MDKDQARNTIKEKRRALTNEYIGLHSALIFNNLRDFGVFDDISRIFTYVSAYKEVDTINIIKFCLDQGIKVCAPRVRGKEMDFVGITDLSQLKPGSFNIPEPVSDDIVVPEQSDVMLVPGIVFDRELNRVGFGGGYYDRYFMEHHDLKTIGLAYDFQVIDHIDTEEFDIGVSALCTETQIITGGGA